MDKILHETDQGMKKYWKIPVVGVLIFLLVLVRMYEYQIFYDPFMYFFAGANMTGSPLEYPPELFFNVILRFLINTAISLAILYIVFQSKSVLRFAAVLYGLFFLMLFPAFIFLIYQAEPDNYLAVFYVRRFLVHPVLLLILLPAFYYQQLNAKAEK